MLLREIALLGAFGVEVADDALEAGAFLALGVAFVAQADVFVAEVAGGVGVGVHGGVMRR